MKYYILLSFILLSCTKLKTTNNFSLENKIPSDDISSLIEMSLNSCDYAKQFYNLNNIKGRTTYISFYKLDNPLTKEIKCFGAPLIYKSDAIGKKDYLIEVYFYKRISPTKFELNYKLANINIIVESTIKFVNNKWVSINCTVSEI